MSYLARQILPGGREGLPAIGAHHPVVIDENVHGFFTQFTTIADQVLTEAATPQLVSNYYTDGEELFDTIMVVEPPVNPLTETGRDPYIAYEERLHLTVLEKKETQIVASTLRRPLQPHDVGRIEGELENDLLRGGYMDEQLTVTFSNVSRVGARLPGAPWSHDGCMLALTPDPEDEEIEDFFAEERDTVISGLVRAHYGHHKRARKLFDDRDFRPHVTFAQFVHHPANSEDTMAEIVGQVKDYLEGKPLVVTLDPIDVLTGGRKIAKAS